MPHVACEEEQCLCAWCGHPILEGDWLYGDGYCSDVCEQNDKDLHARTWEYLREAPTLDLHFSDYQHIFYGE